MLSYIGKVIFLLFFLYTLLVPYTITNSFAEGWLKTERDTRKADENDNIGGRVNGLDKKYLNSDTHKKSGVKENHHTSDAETQNVIARNLQMAGNFLSSSPSELAEQAKSYALGQVNGLVTSEAQKWLSQFGTARINFGLDKKGKRKNGSLDLLLPLYDNKADWLFFSQLGYRNKDSRDTINLGLGGRYFYQDWMYGLNTFYDYDLTGRNQRLGLGGEIWGDYIKLAANTYYRASNWKDSRDFVGYYERPANGYDISGEFFLPAYPNLGAKLTYEQYFGDEVTLFDRDTKQKNPILATLGLSYTPVPLFTLGVDYKQGNGHNETQFLANLSYRLGVPLSVQLSPENVATARTLAGSRYDLVERNNHIVLEHQAKPATQLSLPDNIIGYSGGQQEVTVKFSSESPLKQIRWATNKEFEQNGGKLSSQIGNTIKVTLPTYLSGSDQNNNYPIYAVAEWENNQKSAPAEMRVIVRPFMLKKQEAANFTPAGPLPATGDKKDGYTFDPVITFDTVNNAPIKNATINHVQWTTDPKIGPDTKLQWKNLDASNSGVLDENGHFKHKPILVSQQQHKNVKVYLQLDNQAPQLVGEVSFDVNMDSLYSISKDGIKSEKLTSASAGGYPQYQFMATILGADGNPVKEGTVISDAHWNIDQPSDAAKYGITLTPDTKTDDKGNLKAIITSTKAFKGDVVVSLKVGENKPVQSPSYPVDFKRVGVGISPITSDKGPLVIKKAHNLTVTVTDGNGNPLPNKKVNWYVTEQSETDHSKVTISSSSMTNPQDGKATATLTSSTAQDVTVTASVDGIGTTQPMTVTFAFPTFTAPIFVEQDPPTGKVLGNKTDSYTYAAQMLFDGKPFQNAPKDSKEHIPIKWMSLTGAGSLSLITFNSKEDGQSPEGKLLVVVTSNHQTKLIPCVGVDLGQDAPTGSDPCADDFNSRSFDAP
ncbi:inverse autotransporter beta domain-containing protein [Xenorhabdus griffiniae]|uniref:inverse autotransporter beta domain-containing protein n=1 Tax=Xenorhabdus griffiniae TaxID=351672 RepID=UPI002359F5DA|nr:inverse autotransporter beta domain-containing protein [Xenorhabdus griffiniae]MDC9603629.1 inverse autotransporter beta domain-containing protein [Xenorhabdus griffiniae]